MNGQPSAAAPIIEARGLKRTFKTGKTPVEAVRGVDLTVRQGKMVGFLGPNGGGQDRDAQDGCSAARS